MAHLAPLLPWLSLALAAAAWIAVAAGWFRGRGRRGGGPLLLRAAVAGACSVFFWWSVRTADLDPRDLGISALSPVGDVTALTDGGTEVRLSTLDTVVATGEVPVGFAGRLIVASGGTARSNCHGWVFTGGRYVIPGDRVDTILRENGYETVSSPLPGDLVIYRDDAGTPVHTGIVKAIGTDGFVLVESKWGQLDVFWHIAEEPAYGSRFEYRRSGREGHLLRLSRHADARSRVLPAPTRAG